MGFSAVLVIEIHDAVCNWGIGDVYLITREGDGGKWREDLEEGAKGLSVAWQRRVVPSASEEHIAVQAVSQGFRCTTSKQRTDGDATRWLLSNSPSIRRCGEKVPSPNEDVSGGWNGHHVEYPVAEAAIMGSCFDAIGSRGDIVEVETTGGIGDGHKDEVALLVAKSYVGVRERLIIRVKDGSANGKGLRPAHTHNDGYHRGKPDKESAHMIYSLLVALWAKAGTKKPNGQGQYDPSTENDKGSAFVKRGIRSSEVEEDPGSQRQSKAKDREDSRDSQVIPTPEEHRLIAEKTAELERYLNEIQTSKLSQP